MWYFHPPEDLWWPLGDLNHWINTLLAPVDQHKLDPWSWQIYHHDALFFFFFLKASPSRGAEGVWAGRKQWWWQGRAPSVSRSKVKMIKEAPACGTWVGALGERGSGSGKGPSRLLGYSQVPSRTSSLLRCWPCGWTWCLGEELRKMPYSVKALFPSLGTPDKTRSATLKSCWLRSSYL